MKILRKMKQELEKNDLLYKNEYFINSLKENEIIIFGVDVLNKFELEMINELRKYTKVEIIDDRNYKIDKAYLFNDKNEQIRYIFEEISNLLKKDIPLSKIKLANIQEGDYPYIKRISSAYNIPVAIKENTFYATNNYKNIKTNILENKLDDLEENKYINKLISKINGLKNINNLEEILDEYAKEIYIDELDN